MKKNRIIAIALALALVSTAAGVTAFATAGNAEKKEESGRSITAAKSTNMTAVKDETVYVIANTDGSAKKIIVSNQFENTSLNTAESNVKGMSDVENVKGDDCWLGTTEKNLPVEMRIKYTLDGKTVTANELAGKSGHVTIRFDYENKQYEMVNVGGKQEKIYVPFAVLTGAVLNSDRFSNIAVSNGKQISDGDKTALIGLAFPGLQEDLGIDANTLEIPDYVEISADVKDFELDTTLTIITNSVFNNLDSSKLDNLDFGELSGRLTELTNAMNQLMDGSSKLYDGLCTLAEKSVELSGGMNQLSNGLNELENHNTELNSGAKQVFNSLLSTADTQLAASGLKLPALTIENYSGVLNDVLSQMDSAGTYAENAARQQVEQAVRAKKSTVSDAVKKAVEQEVTQKVTETVRQTAWQQVLASKNLTQETYEAGVASGAISEAQSSALKAALKQQMSSAAIQSKIEDTVKAQMNSNEVAAIIDAKTEEQLQLLINQNMASADVQEKIMAATKQASEGAVKIRALKQQLDSYNAFYSGLTSYTAGVASAACGASKIQSNMPALIDGITQLRDGAMQLSDGLKELNEKGIQKLVNSFNGDLGNLAERVEATADVSKHYCSFTGLSDGMEGNVKFIYRTETIE